MALGDDALNGEVFLELAGVELLQALARWEDLGPAGDAPEAGILVRHRTSGLYGVRHGGTFRSITDETGRRLAARFVKERP